MQLYWLTMFNDEGDRFPFFFLNLFVALMAAESAMMAIAAVIPHYVSLLSNDKCWSRSHSLGDATLHLHVSHLCSTFTCQSPLQYIDTSVTFAAHQASDGLYLLL